MTDARTEARWDHARDLRKHDGPRPHDRIPDRLNKPLSNAMDVVVLVKAMPNYEDCAALIERYASGLREVERLDAVAAGARP